MKSSTPGELGNVADGILANSVTAKWNPEDDSDAIGDITFEIKKGQCYGICGSVGDGKVNDEVFLQKNYLFGIELFIRFLTLNTSRI